jgi:hypothetical protein
MNPKSALAKATQIKKQFDNGLVKTYVFDKEKMYKVDDFEKLRDLVSILVGNFSVPEDHPSFEKLQYLLTERIQK